MKKHILSIFTFLFLINLNVYANTNLYETYELVNLAENGFTSHSSVFSWTVSSGHLERSSGAGNEAWVLNSFSGANTIGFEPVSVTLQSFAYTNMMTANANRVGIISSSWR
ncbi:MAG: hypothetical protein FWF57_03315 [Defluviitaleaceae bacterium]|nr:hypothetical protein [Defluviitaleaceae bacterium]